MKSLNIPTAINLAGKDLKIYLKERGTILYLFLIPILFILAFGSAAGVSNEPKEKAIILPVVNLDMGSKAGDALIEALNRDGSIQLEFYDEANAQAALDKEKINRVLTIPAGYGTDLEAGRHVKLLLVNGPDANPITTEALQRMLTGMAADLSLQMQLIASFQQMADMQAGASQEEQVFTSEIIVEQAQRQFERAKTEPLLAIEDTWPQHLQEGDEQAFSPLSMYVPGFAVLFIFLTAQTTAQSIYEEKKFGSFRRLLAAPISKATILVGKIMPNFITGLAQIIILFGTGVFLLPLIGLDRMSLGNDPLALVLVCLVLLFCSGSLGVLIAAIARTEGQISGLSQVVLWTFGFAGIWFQQMPSSQLLDTISLMIPHYWANIAFTDLFIRGQGLGDITTSLYALLGFTAVFFAVGLWRFDFN